MPNRQSKQVIEQLEQEGWERWRSRRVKGDTTIMLHSETGEAMHVHGTMGGGNRGAANLLARARRKVRFAESQTHQLSAFLRRKYEVEPDDFRDTYVYHAAIIDEFAPHASPLERRKLIALLGVSASSGRLGVEPLERGHGGGHKTNAVKPSLWRIYGAVAWEAHLAALEGEPSRRREQATLEPQEPPGEAAAPPEEQEPAEPADEESAAPAEPEAATNGRAPDFDRDHVLDLLRHVAAAADSAVAAENEDLRLRLSLAADEAARLGALADQQAEGFRQIAALLRGDRQAVEA